MKAPRREVNNSWALGIIGSFIVGVLIFILANSPMTAGTDANPGEELDHKAECENYLEAIDETVKQMEGRGEIPVDPRKPSDVLQARWGNC